MYEKQGASEHEVLLGLPSKDLHVVDGKTMHTAPEATHAAGSSQNVLIIVKAALTSVG